MRKDQGKLSLIKRENKENSQRIIKISQRIIKISQRIIKISQRIIKILEKQRQRQIIFKIKK
jgi:hypothetical protein